MARVLYTAEATVTGGRADGRGRTSDGAVEVDPRLPAAMGGQGGGTNPEQLLAIGYAACFEAAIGVAARREGVEAGDVSVASRVHLSPTARGFGLAVEAAHQVCPYSNATRGNIDVTLTANGVPVG
jgi:Ohr subfamily peroxiredoxin